MFKKHPEPDLDLDYDFILSNSMMQQQQQQHQQEEAMACSSAQALSPSPGSFTPSYPLPSPQGGSSELLYTIPDISDVSPSGGFVAELMRPELDPAYLHPTSLHGKFVVKTTMDVGEYSQGVSVGTECISAPSESVPSQASPSFPCHRIKQENPSNCTLSQPMDLHLAGVNSQGRGSQHRAFPGGGRALTGGRLPSSSSLSPDHPLNREHQALGHPHSQLNLPPQGFHQSSPQGYSPYPQLSSMQYQGQPAAISTAVILEFVAKCAFILIFTAAALQLLAL